MEAHIDAQANRQRLIDLLREESPQRKLDMLDTFRMSEPPEGPPVSCGCLVGHAAFMACLDDPDLRDRVFVVTSDEDGYTCWRLNSVTEMISAAAGWLGVSHTRAGNLGRFYEDLDAITQPSVEEAVEAIRRLDGTAHPWAQPEPEVAA